MDIKAEIAFQEAMEEIYDLNKRLIFERSIRKQLEKDFQNAAYATIRSFVLKFTKLGILSFQQYGNRTKYKLIL